MGVPTASPPSKQGDARPLTVMQGGFLLLLTGTALHYGLLFWTGTALHYGQGTGAALHYGQGTVAKKERKQKKPRDETSRGF